MKLRDYFFINEPSDEINDSASIRILTEPSADEAGGYEYALEVTTLDYIRTFLDTQEKTSYSGYGEPVMILRRLDRATIEAAIAEILPNIDKVARRVE